jgi:hypothetical protein
MPANLSLRFELPSLVKVGEQHARTRRLSRRRSAAGRVASGSTPATTCRRSPRVLAQSQISQRSEPPCNAGPLRLVPIGVRSTMSVWFGYGAHDH